MGVILASCLLYIPQLNTLSLTSDLHYWLVFTCFTLATPITLPVAIPSSRPTIAMPYRYTLSRPPPPLSPRTATATLSLTLTDAH